MPSAWVPHGGEGELGEIFRGWSKEGAGKREMESDVVSVLISKSYSATEEPTFAGWTFSTRGIFFCLSKTIKKNGFGPLS